MEVRDTGPGMASILQEMGVSYNPQRLANALKGRQLEVNARALRITYTLGRFIAGLAKVGCSLHKAHCRIVDQSSKSESSIYSVGNQRFCPPSYNKIVTYLECKHRLFQAASSKTQCLFSLFKKASEREQGKVASVKHDY